MDRQRPVCAWSRPWLTMSAVAWLAACQGLPQLSLFDPSPQAAGPGWRVVERLGEARYLAPGMAGWEEVAAGSMIPAGSQITTGTGGRLIVHQAANQLSVGTGSRFILPGWEPGDSVRHTAGWLRYRIARAPAGFGIETPFLDLEADEAVVDVTVGESETEVAVVSGRVRVRTLDERRQIDLRAGYSGYASLEGEALAVRRGPGQGLEAVPPIVLPALHPDRAASASVAPDPAGTGTTAIAAFAGRRPGVRRSTRAERGAAAGAGRLARRISAGDRGTGGGRSCAARPASGRCHGAGGRGVGVRCVNERGPPGAGPLAHAEPEPAEQIRRRFDGLTEGLLDGLLPALPQGDGR